MNLKEIKAAIERGEPVYWSHKGYQVIKDSIGQYLIKCLSNESCIGLTWSNGTTLNGEESDFFTGIKRDFSWTKIKNDVNGNGRYVIHFLSLLTEEEKNSQSWELGAQYQFACKRANSIGGRKFHNKSYGGGIVFQSCSIQETENAIVRVLERAEKGEKAGV